VGRHAHSVRHDLAHGSERGDTPRNLEDHRAWRHDARARLVHAVDAAHSIGHVPHCQQAGRPVGHRVFGCPGHRARENGSGEDAGAYRGFYYHGPRHGPNRGAMDFAWGDSVATATFSVRP
jgi:hypothetical protein